MVALMPILFLTIASGFVAFRLRRDRLTTFWLLWSGIIHIVMEASYGAFHYVVTSRSTITFGEFVFSRISMTAWLDPRWWASIYVQYARYDGRYFEGDPVVIFICYTEFL